MQDYALMQLQVGGSLKLQPGAHVMMACSCSQLPFLGAKLRFSASPSRPRLRPSVRVRGSSSDPDQGLADSGDLQLQLRAAARVFEAVEAYKLLLAQPDEKIDLLKAASLVACHRYPLLDHELLVDQLDDLAVQVEGTLPAGAPRYPLRTLQAISQHLYQTLGFRGNKEDYYSPDNSCINRVLELRTGIPITLALVYMEVARRVGLPMLGVNIPGHFFITPSLEGTEFLVDPFQGGEISFLQDVESTLEGIYGNPVKLPPQLLENKHPLPARVFLARMLNNLKQVYMIQEDYASAYTISTYQQATRPMDPDIVRDAGLFLYYLGRIPECRETLTRYLQMCPPDAEDADKIRRLLERLSQQQ